MTASYRREDQLYEDVKSCLLDENGYKRQREKVRAERDHYTKLLHESQCHELDAYLERANIVLELAQDAKMLWKTRSAIEKRDFLKKLLWNPRLDPPTVVLVGSWWVKFKRHSRTSSVRTRSLVSAQAPRRMSLTLTFPKSRFRF